MPGVEVGAEDVVYLAGGALAAGELELASPAAAASGGAHRHPDAGQAVQPRGTASMEGIAAAHAIRSAHPRTGVVVLSQYADESYAFELFRDGTVGLVYLLKDRVGEVGRLLEALREVSAGGSLIDPQVVEALVRGRARVRASALRDLTPSELDVLREMAQGCGNAGIAAHLHLSESSVESTSTPYSPSSA